MTATGTVFDIGYQSYDGTREGRMRALTAVYKDGVRIALGFGRGPRAKVLPWFFIAVLSMIGLVMAIIAGAANTLGGEGAAEKMNLPTHSDYYGIASMILFVFASIVGPELLCRDRREGTISLYLVRPLTGADYVAGRWLAFLSVLLLATLLPQTILFLGLCGGSAEPLKYFESHWLDIPKFLAAGLVLSAFLTTVAMLVASFTTRRAYAAVFLVGLFLITTPFTVGVAQGMEGTLAQWLSMFALSNIPLHVSDMIFNKPSELTENNHAKELGKTVLALWYLAWITVMGAVIWFRYRRLTP